MSGLRAFVRLIGPDRGRFAAAVACGLASQLATVGIAAATGVLAGAALRGDPPAVLGPPAIVAAVLLLPRAVLPFFETLLAHDVAFRCLVQVRGLVLDAVARLTPAGLQLRVDHLAARGRDVWGLGRLLCCAHPTERVAKIALALHTS